MRTPRKIDVCVTHRCNLRCSYCSFFTSAADVDTDLPAEDWVTFFDECRRNRVTRAILSGGEPFIRDDLPILIEALVHNRMRFSILSNGILITDELASFLASTERCDYVQVSVDGAGPESHDIFRGEGTFEKAIQGIQVLQRNGIRTTVRVTIHKGNLHNLEAVARLLLDDLGLASFGTNSASYSGLCRAGSDRIRLTAKDRVAAMETILRLSERYPNRISAASGPLADAKSWNRWETARNEGKTGLPGGGRLTACGGVFETIAIRADGVMTPCAQLSHIELGQINRDDVGEIWRGHPELLRLRERHSIPLDSFEYCRGCAYIGFCTGNCPATAYNHFGTDQHPSPDACLKRFRAEVGQLPGAPWLD